MTSGPAVGPPGGAGTPCCLVKITPAHFSCSAAAPPQKPLPDHALDHQWRGPVARSLAFAGSCACILLNLYGSSERWRDAASIKSAMARIRQGRAPSAAPSPIRRSMCWTASLQPVPIGVPGELYIGGAGRGAGLSQPARAHGRAVHPQPVQPRAGRPPVQDRGPGPLPAGWQHSSFWDASTIR